jgi:hypothetical protein
MRRCGSDALFLIIATIAAFGLLASNQVTRCNKNTLEVLVDSDH